MKTLLIFSSILFLVGVVVGLPAEARIREQVDTEHEEGIDRVKLRLRDMKAVETGNKEKQYGAQETEIEKRRGGGGGRGRSRGGDPGDEDVDADRDRDRDADRGYEGSSRGGKGSRGRSKSRPPADEDPEDAEAAPAAAAAPKSRSRDRDVEREPERDRERDRDRERGSSRGGRGRSRSRGGGGVSSERAKDTKVSEVEKEDINRFATQDDIDFTKDSFRTKDKKSHKKEEVYITRKRR